MKMEEKNRVRIMEVTVVGQLAMNIDMMDKDELPYTDKVMLNDKNLVDFLENFDRIISLEKKMLGVKDAREYLSED